MRYDYVPTSIDRVETTGLLRALLSDGPRNPPTGSATYLSCGKRLFDVGLCCVLLPVVLPIVAALAVLILLTGSLPFYAQPRVGRQGRVFNMLKLRTMRCHSEVEFNRYLAAHPVALHEWRTTQKLKADPRVTRLGAFLRRTSLDELPQFWNVLCGEMSLVGPRPILVTQWHLYTGQSYYELRPGISGNWQVSRRNSARFADRVIFDEQYRNTLSLIGDTRILWQTLWTVLRATGC